MKLNKNMLIEFVILIILFIGVVAGVSMVAYIFENILLKIW